MEMKLITPDGSWNGVCDIKEYMLCINHHKPVRFDYGVIVPDNSSHPIAVMNGKTISTKDGVYMTFEVFRGVYGQTVFTPHPFRTTHHIEFGLPLNIWDFLVQQKAVTAEPLDCLLLCPECTGIPLVRPGCPECGNPFTRPDQLVHHYACGNVDFLEKYTIDRVSGSLTCHKCNKSDLIINCDYDVSVGLHRCMKCGWTGEGPKMIGECMSCNTKFRMTEAKEVIINRYTLIV